MWVFLSRRRLALFKSASKKKPLWIFTKLVPSFYTVVVFFFIPISTECTLEGFLSCVNHDVVKKHLTRGELLVAHGANQKFFASMKSTVLG